MQHQYIVALGDGQTIERFYYGPFRSKAAAQMWIDQIPVEQRARYGDHWDEGAEVIPVYPSSSDPH